jgi:hypothetical protein
MNFIFTMRKLLMAIFLIVIPMAIFGSSSLVIVEAKLIVVDSIQKPDLNYALLGCVERSMAIYSDDNTTALCFLWVYDGAQRILVNAALLAGNISTITDLTLYTDRYTGILATYEHILNPPPIPGVR